MTVAYEKNPDGSISLPVSAEIVRAMALRDSGAVTMDLHNGQLIIEARPERRLIIPQFTIEELLADYDQIPKDEAEDRLWLNSPPVGRELI